MKVLDLQCGNGHVFEGWFAGEDDYLSQSRDGLIQCPACGNPSITKKLSVPRLSISRTDATHDTVQAVAHDGGEPQQVLAAWLELTRQVLANTTDVGNRFADEARKMHYRDAEARSIRGTATVDETRSLLNEGIEVMHLILPESFKGTLQ